MTNLGLPAAKVRIFSLAKGVFVQIFYDGDRGWGMGDGVGHACDAGVVGGTMRKQSSRK